MSTLVHTCDFPGCGQEFVEGPKQDQGVLFRLHLEAGIRPEGGFRALHKLCGYHRWSHMRRYIEYALPFKIRCEHPAFMRCPTCSVLFWKQAADPWHYSAEFMRATILTTKFRDENDVEKFHMITMRDASEHSLHNTTLCAKCTLALRVAEEGHGSVDDFSFLEDFRKSTRLAEIVWREHCVAHRRNNKAA